MKENHDEFEFRRQHAIPNSLLNLVFPPRFQGNPSAVLVAATAAGRGVRHQHKAAGRNGVDPATGPHAAKVAVGLVFLKVEIAECGRAIYQQVGRGSQHAAAVRALEIERFGLAAQHIPSATLGVDGLVIDHRARAVAGIDVP